MTGGIHISADRSTNCGRNGRSGVGTGATADNPAGYAQSIGFGIAYGVRLDVKIIGV